MTLYTDLLAEFDSEKHLVCHLEPYVGGGFTEDLYYSTHGFISEPSDTPANQYYDSRLKNSYEFQRSLFSGGRLTGSSVPSFGSITLINTDGELDILADYRWGGRRVRIWMGGPDFDLADYGLVFDGTAEGIEVGDGEITIRLRDLKYLFDKEIQAETFAVTGFGSDVVNRRKPLPYGMCRNVPLLYTGVDGNGKHSFFAGANIIGVYSVRDLGLELTFIDPAGVPTPGQWTCDLTTGVITLGGSFSGPVTGDVIGTRYLSAASSTSWTVGTGSKAFTIDAGLAFTVGMMVRVTNGRDPETTWGDGLVTAYSGTTLTVLVSEVGDTAGTDTDWVISPWGTVAGIVKAIGTLMGVTTFDEASFADIDTAQPATVGYYIDEGGNALGHLDAICNGASCHYGFTRAAEFQIGRLSIPGTADSSYGASDIIDDTFQRQIIEDPAYEVVVRYGRNWFGSMADNQLVGAVSDTDRSFLTNEWRQAKVTDLNVLDTFPQSTPIIVDSIFDDATVAEAEAERLMAMFGVPRAYYIGRFKMQPLSLDIGGTTTITHARYGLSEGVDLRRVELGENLNTFEVEMGLWG